MLVTEKVSMLVKKSCKHRLQLENKPSKKIAAKSLMK